MLAVDFESIDSLLSGVSVRSRSLINHLEKSTPRARSANVKPSMLDYHDIMGE